MKIVQADKLALSFIGLQAFCWVLVPSLFNANLPLDVIEALSWGREWQWGYHKHPPMKPWLAEGVGALFTYADWSLYLLLLCYR